MSLYSFDPENGDIHFERKLNEELSLGCSLVNQKKKVIYLCNECDLFPDTPYSTGRECCIRIDNATGGSSE